MIDRAKERNQRSAERYAEALIRLGRADRTSMATIDRVIVGPTTRPDVDWVVVLYRSTQVDDHRQLIGFGLYVSDRAWSELTDEEFAELVVDHWRGHIDEPPGSDLPESQLVPGGVAWWLRVHDWSTKTGPPGDGLPARITLRG